MRMESPSFFRVNPSKKKHVDPSTIVTKGIIKADSVEWFSLVWLDFNYLIFTTRSMNLPEFHPNFQRNIYKLWTDSVFASEHQRRQHLGGSTISNRETRRHTSLCGKNAWENRRRKEERTCYIVDAEWAFSSRQTRHEYQTSWRLAKTRNRKNVTIWTKLLTQVSHFWCKVCFFCQSSSYEGQNLDIFWEEGTHPPAPF